MNESVLIYEIKNNNQNIIEHFYTTNKNPFLFFFRKYSKDNELLLDIYQDSVVIFCENARKGKLDDLKSSAKTYLFGIGKFCMLQAMRKKHQQIIMDDVSEIPEIPFEDFNGINNIQLQLIKNGLAKLGEQCKKILTLFFYEEKKLEEIQTLLNYSSKDVLKTQKSRCMKQLKDNCIN